MQAMTDKGRVGMSFWQFYQHALTMVRRIDPKFPMFDQPLFIEQLINTAEYEWECLRPYIRGARYDEYWDSLSDRRRLWNWLFKTIWWASYGARLPIEVGIFGCTVYKNKDILRMLPAPVPARDEILGGPAITLKFSDSEIARLRKCEYLRIRNHDAKEESNGSPKRRGKR